MRGDFILKRERVMLAASADALYDFPVETCGALARAVFADGHRARVTAVFESSFYIEGNGGTACVVGRGADAGPLNLIVPASRPVNWPASGLRVGADVRLDRSKCVVAQRFRFDMTAATPWLPSAPAGHWNGATLRVGLDALREIVAARAPADGLGRLACKMDRRGGGTALVAQAEQTTAVLSVVLEAALAAPRSTTASDFACAGGLLGLGPGLTPSGDDFLGGLMMALQITGQGPTCDALWRALAPAAETRTHAIARAHLAGAAQGMGSAIVHDVLNATLEGRIGDLDDLCRALDQLGHTSGWDIVAGAVCALDAASKITMRPAHHRETTAVPG